MLHNIFNVIAICVCLNIDIQAHTLNIHWTALWNITKGVLFANLEEINFV